jgi:hypothetical protein
MAQKPLGKVMPPLSGAQAGAAEAGAAAAKDRAKIETVSFKACIIGSYLNGIAPPRH